MSTVLATEDVMSLPIQINDVSAVDDNAGVHYETVMTGRLITTLYQSGILVLQGNIRPEHKRQYAGQHLSAGNKQRIKQERWTRELIAGNAIIGNLSLRVSSDPEVWFDEDERQTNMRCAPSVKRC